MSTCNRRPAFRFYLRGAHRQIGLGKRARPARWRRRPRLRELLQNGPDWARTSDPALIKRML
jgi:hypothetical protein